MYYVTEQLHGWLGVQRLRSVCLPASGHIQTICFKLMAETSKHVFQTKGLAK